MDPDPVGSEIRSDSKSGQSRIRSDPEFLSLGRSGSGKISKYILAFFSKKQRKNERKYITNFQDYLKIIQFDKRTEN